MTGPRTTFTAREDLVQQMLPHAPKTAAHEQCIETDVDESVHSYRPKAYLYGTAEHSHNLLLCRDRKVLEHQVSSPNVA